MQNAVAQSPTAGSVASAAATTCRCASHCHAPLRLFCYTVAMPGGPIAGSLRLQQQKGMGVWSCDGSSVFSNRTSLFPGLTADAVIDGPMAVGINPNGSRGDWSSGAALNAPVFMYVWRALARRRALLSHYHVIIKIDPDTMFYAPRMRHLLHSLPSGRQGCYTHNRVVHAGPGRAIGPLEAIGTGAFFAILDHLDGCAGDSAPAVWGEDIWLMKCISSLQKHPPCMSEPLEGRMISSYNHPMADGIQPRFDLADCQATPALHEGEFRTAYGYQAGLERFFPRPKHQQCPSAADCTELVLGTLADGHTCGDRIAWVRDRPEHPLVQYDACSLVAAEFPRQCGACAPQAKDRLRLSPAQRAEVQEIVKEAMRDYLDVPADRRRGRRSAGPEI
jgi:hypothetical protein